MRALPAHTDYGVSFSKLHADELHLDWKATYLAILDDLGVKKLRLSAHWPMIEPQKDTFNFMELDFQMREAAGHGASVILAVGRKTPGWPECHTPRWVEGLSTSDEHAARVAYITAVVERYRNSPALGMWQVENEPFLNFARSICGEPDEDFFAEEIALVRSLDPKHKILVTDGGEFGLWYKARRHGDIFGSTMYLYVWSTHIGYWRYPISAGFFRFKQNLLDAIAGKKPSISIEVGLEPWLAHPIVEVSLDEQLQHMSMDRFDEILSFASKTGFSEEYLWGAEWWYYMKEKHEHPEFWDAAKKLYKE
ncbi:MAG: beta-galactosidase [bacterium]|nr:beta-galactosidase [bacterium]